MPVFNQIYGIKPWEYYDRLPYLDWRDLRAHIDAMNEQGRSRR
jgi:hypothetical protein